MYVHFFCTCVGEKKVYVVNSDVLDSVCFLKYWCIKLISPNIYIVYIYEGGSGWNGDPRLIRLVCSSAVDTKITPKVFSVLLKIQI